MKENLIKLLSEEKIFPIIRTNDAQVAIDTAKALIDGGEAELMSEMLALDDLCRERIGSAQHTGGSHHIAVCYRCADFRRADRYAVYPAWRYHRDVCAQLVKNLRQRFRRSVPVQITGKLLGQSAVHGTEGIGVLLRDNVYERRSTPHPFAGSHSPRRPALPFLCGPHRCRKL